MMKKYLPLILLVFACVSPTEAQIRMNGKNVITLKKISVNYDSKGQSGFEGFESKGLTGLQPPGHYGKWAKIEVEYSSDIDWANEINLEFFIQLGEKTVLSRQITQINVPLGPRHFAAVFIHPTTLLHYGEVIKATVQVSYSNQAFSTAGWPHRSKNKWWEQMTSINGLLKKVYETPFIMDQPDRYEDTR